MIDPHQSLSLLAMFMIGLVGSGHCAGMCGGITTALGMAADRRRTVPLVTGYNLGRILSYAVAGALVATLGQWSTQLLAVGPVIRIAAGVILVLMGLYLVGWWPLLAGLERAGGVLWRRLQPLGNRLLPVTTPSRALLIGAVWGWLPCGLVYTALVYAATSANTLEGATMMMAFGLGTAPAMLAGGLFAGRVKQYLQSRPLRLVMAGAMVAFGSWTVSVGVGHLQGGHGDHGGSDPGAAAHSHY